MPQVPVRRTPQTSVAAPQEAYARGQSVDLSPIIKPIQQFQDDLKRETRNFEKIDLANRLVEETNRMQADFEQRKNTTDPAGLARGVQEDYLAQHNALLKQLHGMGYSNESLGELSAQLGEVRQHFNEHALAFQAQSLMAQAGSDHDRMETNLSQYLVNNPDGLESAQAQFDHGVDIDPRLDPVRREAMKSHAREVFKQAAGGALVAQNPDLVIEKLDPSGKMAPPKAAPTAPTTGDVNQIISGMQGAVVQSANALKLDPVEMAAVVSFESSFDPKRRNASDHLGLIQFGRTEQEHYHINENSSPADWSRAITQFALDRGFKPGQMGIREFYSTVLHGNPHAADTPDSNGTTVANAIPRILSEHRAKAQEWLARAAAPMDQASGFEPSDDLIPGNTEAPDRPIASIDPGGGPSVGPPQVGTGQTVHGYEVVTNADRSQWDKRADGSDKGMGWLGLLKRPDGGVSSEISVGVEINGKETDIPLMVPGLTKPELDYLMTHDPEKSDFVKNLPSSIMEKAEAFARSRLADGKSPFRGPDEEAQPPKEPSLEEQIQAAKTGIPALDAMDGPARLQILQMAYQRRAQRETSDRAAVDVRMQNGNAERMATGADTGPTLTHEMVMQAYKSNPVEGEQKWAEYNSIGQAGPAVQRMKTMSPTAIQADLDRIKPKAGSSTYAVDEQIYEAAQRAAAHVMEQRKQDPAAYVMSAFPNVTQMSSTAKTPTDIKSAYMAMQNAYQTLGIPRDQWSPITKDQAERIGQQYLSASPTQRVRMLDEWFITIPRPMIPALVTTLIEKNSAVKGNIGRDAFLYAALAGHPEFHSVMSDAIAGAEAQVDTSRRLPQDKVDQSWRTSLGKAGPTLNAAAAENYKQAAMDLYINAGGKVPTVAGEQLDPALWNESLRRAVGGLKNNKNTGFATFHGTTPTILPPTVTKQEFQGWVDRITPDMLWHAAGGSGGYTKFGKPALIRDIQDHGTFVMKAPGAYAVQFPDGHTLSNNKGGEYILHITPQLVRGK